MTALSELLDPSLIQTAVSASSFAEALEKSYAPFLSQGLIEEAYIEEVRKAYQESGPYFVLAKGIAMPHCDAFSLVNKSSLGATVLKEPVLSGNKANDPVRILFPLCTVDASSHIHALSGLADILSRQETMNRILESDDPDEIYQLIISGGDSL